MKKQAILRDHKKIGKKFVPPVLQLGITEVSYINLIFPEILWMGMLTRMMGYYEGIQAIEIIAKRAKEYAGEGPFMNFAIASSYSMLGGDEKVRLVDFLDEKELLQTFQNALAPLICLYEGFPMSFIGPPSELEAKESLITNMKSCISELIDRNQQPGVVMQANLMYILAITGGLIINESIKMPDFDKLVTDFGSDAARKAASAVRAFAIANPTFSDRKSGADWARSFWDQGYKIDKCDIKWGGDV